MQKVKFLDAPIESIIDWLSTVEQRKIRSAINAKYKGNVSEQIYWVEEVIGVNDGLSEEPIERLSQRLTLSQVSQLVAQRFFNKFRFFIMPILFILSALLIGLFGYNEIVLQNDSLSTVLQVISLTSFIFLILSSNALSAFIFQLFLPNSPINDREISRIEDTIKNCVVRDIKDGTPDDFKDRLRVLDVDANGKAVAGQILARDLYCCALDDEWQKKKYLIRLVGLVFFIPFASLSPLLAIPSYLLFVLLTQKVDEITPQEQQQEAIGSIIIKAIKWLGFPYFILMATTEASFGSIFATVSNAPILVNAIVIFFFLAWIVLVNRFFNTSKSPILIRSLELHNAVRQSGTELLIDKASRNYFLSLEQAKNVQIDNVIKDKSPFIKLGTSTGLFSQRRDHFAPSEVGLPVGLTMQDLSTHLFTLGASGTGKTTGVIRPVIHQWMLHDAGGLLVLDGKGALPKELDGIHADYQIITPTAEKFNPIFGMTPDAVAETISSLFESKDSKDSFWNDASRLMLRMSAIVVKNDENKTFNLKNIVEFCSKPQSEINEIINSFIQQEKHLNDAQLDTAYQYWYVQAPQLSENQRSSIVMTVSTWIGNITSHKKLGHWVDVESGVQIEEVFNGAKIGVLLPESEYGKGATLINAIIMRRLYDFAKKRGDNYASHDSFNKPMLLVADEVQNMITQADVENVTIARSLGMYLCFATQNIDGLYNRLDEVSAKQMIGNFASLIAFSTRTKISNEYIAQRASKIWKSTVDHFEGLPDSQTEFNIYLNNGAYSAHFSHDMYRISNDAEDVNYRPNRAYSLASKIPVQTEQGMVEEFTREGVPSATLGINLTSIIEEEEIENILSVPQTAIALLNRGRVPRRDVIKLDLMGAK